MLCVLRGPCRLASCAEHREETDQQPRDGRACEVLLWYVDVILLYMMYGIWSAWCVVYGVVFYILEGVWCVA